MAVLPILTVPHPLLKQKSRPVRQDEFGEPLEAHMRDMAETMFAAPGVGLAGVQIGDLRRIIVADLKEEGDEEHQAGDGLIMLVNPEILEFSKEKMVWEEGCLSVPDFWQEFNRPRSILLRYQTPQGETQEQRLEGYPAIIIQHEMDHLEGVVLLDRVSRLKRRRYLEKVKKWERQAALED